MIPLRVTARVRGEISLTHGYLHLDGLLAWAVCQRDRIPPAMTPDEWVPVEIPVERSECGRYHLCSASIGRAEWHEVRYTVRRFPIERGQKLLPEKVRRVNLSAGAQKHFRIPRTSMHLQDDELRWHLLGEPEEVERLLSLVHYLGKRRAVAAHRPVEWSVEEDEPWGDGYPVLRDGQPLRHLPADLPGLRTERRMFGRLSYPYHQPALGEELIATPEPA